MLSPEQINEIHRLHLVEKWPQRRIARHLHIGRHTLAKYLDNPAPPPSHRDRASKLDVFKPAVADLLEKDPKAPATVLNRRLQTLGYDGGERAVASPPASPTAMPKPAIRIPLPHD